MIFNAIPIIIIESGTISESTINSEGISFILNKIFYGTNKRIYFYIFDSKYIH